MAEQFPLFTDASPTSTGTSLAANVFNTLLLTQSCLLSGGIPAAGSLTLLQPATTALVTTSTAAVALSLAAQHLVVPASMDTYVDLTTGGTYVLSSVANNATAPAVTASSLRLYRAVANASTVTAVLPLVPQGETPLSGPTPIAATSISAPDETAANYSVYGAAAPAPTDTLQQTIWRLWQQAENGITGIPQTAVTYDSTEAATSAGSSSLEDNLNHLRLAIAALFGGAFANAVEATSPGVLADGTNATTQLTADPGVILDSSLASPHAIAVVGSTQAWVLNTASSTNESSISRFNVNGTSAGPPLALGTTGAIDLVVLPTEVWVLTNTLISRWTYAGASNGTITSGNLFYPSASTLIGSYVWVTSETQLVAWVYTTSGTFVTSITVPSSYDLLLQATPVGSNVWLVGISGATSVYTPAGAVVGTITTPVLHTPQGILPVGSQVWIGDQDNLAASVYICNADGTVASTLTGNGLNYPMPEAVYGTNVWILNQQGNQQSASVFTTAGAVVGIVTANLWLANAAAVVGSALWVVCGGVAGPLAVFTSDAGAFTAASAVVATTAVQVGTTGTPLTGVLMHQYSRTGGVFALFGGSTDTVTVTGAAVGQTVVASYTPASLGYSVPSYPPFLAINAGVTAANTVSITCTFVAPGYSTTDLADYTDPGGTMTLLVLQD